MSHVKGASILAAYLKMLPFIFIVLPGMISRALYPGACTQMWAENFPHRHTPSKCEKGWRVYCKQVLTCFDTTRRAHPFFGLCKFVSTLFLLNHWAVLPILNPMNSCFRITLDFIQGHEFLIYEVMMKIVSHKHHSFSWLGLHLAYFVRPTAQIRKY